MKDFKEFLIEKAPQNRHTTAKDGPYEVSNQEDKDGNYRLEATYNGKLVAYAYFDSEGFSGSWWLNIKSERGDIQIENAKDFIEELKKRNITKPVK